MEFSRPEYWYGVGAGWGGAWRGAGRGLVWVGAGRGGAGRGYSPWNSPGLNTGVGSLSLLQGIFPIKPGSPALQGDSLPTELSGKPPLNSYQLNSS